MNKLLILCINILLFTNPLMASSIRISPAELHQGTLKGDLNFAVSKNISLGPVLYVQQEDKNYRTRNLLYGLRLSYFPMATSIDSTDGYYLACELLAIELNIDTVENGETFSANTNANGLVGIVGYQWRLSNNLNLNFGGGFQNSSTKGVKLVSKSSNKSFNYNRKGTGSQFSSELTLGYIF